MNLHRRLFIGIALVVGVIGLFAAAGVAAIFVAVNRNNQVMSEVEQHLEVHADQLGEAVTELASLHPSGRSVDSNALPLPLRAPGVQGAFIGERHVTLFVLSNPDTDRGFRVWSGAPSKDFADDETSIPDVYRFRYCDDYPESSTNRPD